MADTSTGRTNGFLRLKNNSGSELGIFGAGQQRLQIGSATLDNVGADTAALLHGLGTSTTPVQTTSGSVNLMGYWMQSSATSGDVRGLYTRLFLTGTGGTGEAARIFTTMKDAAGSTARGAHISLDFGDTGTVTGLGVALECTLHIANQATQSGTMSPIKLAIHSDGATSDPSGSLLSYINIVNQGNTTGDDDVDTDVYLFNITGHAAGGMFQTGTNTTIDHVLKIIVDGTPYFIGLYDAAS